VTEVAGADLADGLRVVLAQLDVLIEDLGGTKLAVRDVQLHAAPCASRCVQHVEFDGIGAAAQRDEGDPLRMQAHQVLVRGEL
jgi:hypothetical protein